MIAGTSTHASTNHPICSRSDRVAPTPPQAHRDEARDRRHDGEGEPDQEAHLCQVAGRAGQCERVGHGLDAHIDRVRLQQRPEDDRRQGADDDGPHPPPARPRQATVGEDQRQRADEQDPPGAPDGEGDNHERGESWLCDSPLDDR
jgi:hypothetical protein